MSRFLVSFMVGVLCSGCAQGGQNFDNGEDGVSRTKVDGGTARQPPPQTEPEAITSEPVDAAADVPVRGIESPSSAPDADAASAAPPSSPTPQEPNPEPPPPVETQDASAVDVMPSELDSGAPEAPTLDGTWDVIYSSRTRGTMTMTATLSDTLLQITGDVEFTAMVTDEQITLEHDPDRALAQRVNPGTFDGGMLPTFLLGEMRFNGVPSNGGFCTSRVDADQLSVNCTERVRTLFHALRLANTTLTATRTEVGESGFGELGGEWTLNSGRTSCTASLLGNTVSLACSGGDADGTATFTLDGDTIGGQTSGGIEFTAQRR